jgi:hypothetical protein
MTPGTRLATISARLLHAETFALIVSPAIADLQHEAPGGPLRRLHGYIGVWRAMVGAAWFDLVCRASRILGDDARRSTLQSAFRTWAWLALLQASYYACLFLFMADLGTHTDRGTLLPGSQPGDLIVSGALVVLAATIVLYLAAVVAAHLPFRREGPLD